jgi:hypothetical protein
VVVVFFFFHKSSQSWRAQARRIDVSDMTLSRPPDESLAVICVCVCMCLVQTAEISCSWAGR